MWRIAAENQRTVKRLMDISRRKSEWVGIQESKVRGRFNIRHLSSVVHSMQGSASHRNGCAALSAHLNVHYMCTYVYACGRESGVNFEGMQGVSY